MRVLLTGATGFIGSQIARELLDRGHVVRALVRRGSDRYRIEDIAARLELAEADLFEAPEQELARLAQGTDLCVHAAWYAEPGLYLASPENLRCMHASLKLMEGLAHAGSRRAVFLGSCFEYDFGPEPLSEEKPLNPRSVYAAAKVVKGSSAHGRPDRAADDRPRSRGRLPKLDRVDRAPGHREPPSCRELT